MNLEQLQQSVPSVFATEASPKLSRKYDFIGSLNVVNYMLDAGYSIHSAREMKSRGPNKDFNQRFTKHTVKFTLPQEGDGYNMQAIYVGAHNGTSSAYFGIGANVWACDNGIVSAEELIRFRHVSNNSKLFFEGMERLLPSVERTRYTIYHMQHTPMSVSKQTEFAQLALGLRFKPEDILPYMPEEALCSVAKDSFAKPNLWDTFNNLQESVIRGKQGIHNHYRRITGIDHEVSLNRNLWKLAESYLATR